MPRLTVALAFTVLAHAQPAVRAPAPATLWECSSARRAAQAWTAPPATGTNGTISLAAGGFLTLLGWPTFAHNTALAVVRADAANATVFNFNPATGALVAQTGGQGAPAGACLAPLYGVAFHGAGVSSVECVRSGSPAQSWAWSAADGTLRVAANSSLCLDFGSTFDCSSDGAGVPYCDATAAPAVRAADLAARLGPGELGAVLSSGLIVQPLNYGTNVGLPARGVPPLWFSECCHGAVAECGAPGARGGTGCATSFPAGLAAGASLNTSAWVAAGKFVSTEARAFYNQNKHGLGCFAPNVNPFRDPVRSLSPPPRALCATRDARPNPRPTPIPSPTPRAEVGPRRRGPVRGPLPQWRIWRGVRARPAGRG